MSKNKEKTEKLISKNILFNYFVPNLIIDEDCQKKLKRDRNRLNRIFESKKQGKRVSKEQKEFLETEGLIIDMERKFSEYKAIVWDMADVLVYAGLEKMTSTAIDIGGTTVEIEPDSFKQEDDNLISFQITKVREGIVPAKKILGQPKQDIFLKDEEYIGEFVSILYDCRLKVLMVQSNSHGVSSNQIEKYLTLLRRRYIKESGNNDLFQELACELRVVIDPNKATKILDANYFRKIRIKGNNFMLDKCIDPTSKSLLGKIRRMAGTEKGINFDISFSVESANKTETLNSEDIKNVVDEFNGITELENRPIVEITKKDTEESNIELVNLLNPRFCNIINFKIPSKKSVGHEFLIVKMKETYQKSRGVIVTIMTPR